MTKNCWKYNNPVDVRFGRGCRAELKQVLEKKRCLIVTSERGKGILEVDQYLSESVASRSVSWATIVEANPDVNKLQQSIDSLVGSSIEAVIAFGGGSAIDTGKVLAYALSPVGKGKSIYHMIEDAPGLEVGDSCPLFAVPTTAGTGSEVTFFATIWDRSKRKKLSLSGPPIFPYAAFVDPELTFSMPTEVSLSTGLDAINQAGESIWNRNMTPVTEMFAQQALVLGFDALPRLISDKQDYEASDAMCKASLFAGFAISHTRTSLCHSISYPLTAHFGVPHGLACAFTMPSVLRHNLSADDGRFRRLAKMLLPEGKVDPVALLDHFEWLNNEFSVSQRVKSQIPSYDDLIALRGEMFTPGRVDNSLVGVNDEDVKHILETSWSS